MYIGHNINCFNGRTVNTTNLLTWRNQIGPCNYCRFVFKYGNLNHYLPLMIQVPYKSVRTTPPLFHSIWNNIVSYLNEISLFVKMSEKVVAEYGKLSFQISAFDKRTTIMHGPIWLSHVSRFVVYMYKKRRQCLFFTLSSNFFLVFRCN